MPESVRTARHAMSVAARSAGVTSMRVTTAAGIVATVASLSGCYSYLPTSTSEVAPNSVVTATISDAGRVAIGERVGQEVAALDGKVTQRQDTSVMLMVSQVRFLNGLSNTWQGQEVTLRQQDIKSMTRRTFSRSRTVLMLGALTAGVIALGLSLNFLGVLSGDAGRDKTDPPPPES